MPWIKSHTVLLRHRKVVELAKDLRLKPVYAMGHLHALWHAAIEQQEDGDLSSWSDDLIAQASHYCGSAPQYVSLLQEHGWLDGKLLHDWLDYSGAYLQSKYHNTSRGYLKEVWAKHGKHYGKSTSLRKRKGRVDQSNLISSQIVHKEEGGAGGDSKQFEWPSVRKLVELYNLLTPEECPSVDTISPSRIDKAKKYLKMFPQEEFWRDVFKQIHKSRFLRGMVKNNGHESFIADFDWLLSKGKDQTENVVKVHDGRYLDGR